MVSDAVLKDVDSIWTIQVVTEVFARVTDCLIFLPPPPPLLHHLGSRELWFRVLAGLSYEPALCLSQPPLSFPVALSVFVV